MSIPEELFQITQSLGTVKQRVDEIHDRVLLPRQQVVMKFKDKIEVALYSGVVAFLLMYTGKKLFHW